MKEEKRHHMLYGGDYNPNQWPREEWEKDLKYLKECRINSVTINVFSWAQLQPDERTYYFDELDEFIELCEKEEMEVVLATATAAMPAWMVKRYPEVCRVDFDGRKRKFGKRHNACPNSLVYQKYAVQLVERLAQRYGKKEIIKAWHINNEYGGACFCETCEKEFRIWLQKKYHTLQMLNTAWNTQFWGHIIYEWDEIVAPNLLSEANAKDDSAFEGISVDYRRFNSDGLLNNFLMEKEAIRRYDEKTPVTTNLMGTYKTVDYFRWGKEMDFVSWDNYPSDEDPKSLTAMRHDLMRGLKNGKPFLIMEQNPTQQTFEKFTRKEPGKMRALSYQAMGHGADGILYFQLKQSMGASEKYCGSVISVQGYEDTRVYREVKALGEELEKMGDCFMDAVTPAKVGIYFDWESYWSVEYDRNRGVNKEIQYVNMVHEYYQYFYDRNIPVDMVSKTSDFHKYKLIIGACMYMVGTELGEKVEDYVEQGGRFLATYMSGLVDSSVKIVRGGYAGNLSRVLGIQIEEMDYIGSDLKNRVRFTETDIFESVQQCDIVHLRTAKSCADYCEEGFYYLGMPAVTENEYGRGKAYYIGTRMEQNGIRFLMDKICDAAEIKPIFDENSELEISCREKGTDMYYFLINFKDKSLTVPQKIWGKKNIVTDSIVPDRAELKQYEVLVVREENN